MTQPIPHWPGRLVGLGDHQVYVRRAEGVEGGEGSAPALCVHGLEGSSRNWTDLIDLLRPRLACDAVDLPGFGDSPPRPDGRYSVAALAQTVTALIERSGRGPVHLIANSLGGAICVKVAATRPGLIRTLTLISPALPDSRPRLDLLRFPLMSLPRVGARVIRQYQVLPPERQPGPPGGPGAGIPARFGRLTVTRTEQGETYSVRKGSLSKPPGEHSVVAAAGRARRRADGR
jgi:pimeloyl-ACP methyl ester carboxylesterase